VGPVKHTIGDESKGQVYFPHEQVPTRDMMVALRTKGDPTSLASLLRAEVQALDHEQPIFDVKTMEQRVYDYLRQPRFNMVLIGAFAGLALVLAAVGIYGVISYSVAQRTQEIGIRMALGAQQGDVLRMVLQSAMLLVAIGLGIGLAAALASTRVLQSLLFGVSTTDPATFVAIAVLLAAVALLASYIPARRATKVDPMVALRYE
jgi:putative ABC transport system permease protein